MAWQVLSGNVAAVALLIGLWMHLRYVLYRLSPLQSNLAFGTMMGIAAGASMALSVEVDNGYFLDLRSTLVATSAIYGGPLSVTITALMTGCFRIAMGGAGLFPGLIAIAVVSVAAVLTHYLVRHRLLSSASVWSAAAIVGLVSIAMTAVFHNPNITISFQLLMIGVKVMATAAVSAVMVYFNRLTLERDILRAALMQAPDYHYVKNTRSAFVVTNLHVAKHHGRLKSSEMVGLSDFDLYDAERAKELFEREQKILSSGEALVDFEERLVGQDGQETWYLTSKVPLRNRCGDLVGLAGVTRDITQRKKLEQELLNSRNLLAQAMEEMSDGLAKFDQNGYLLFCNEQYRSAFPRSAYARHPGAHVTDIVRAVVRNAERSDVSPDVDEDWIQFTARQLFETRNTDIPLFDGRWLGLRTRCAADGSVLVVVSDITEIKRSETELKQFASVMKNLADTDALTGISNRRAFDEKIGAHFLHAKNIEAPISLLLIDVDHFKQYNDAYGHMEGDQCLKAIAECLKSVARRPSDLAARYGGEEFAIVLPGVDANGAKRVANELRSGLQARAITHCGNSTNLVTVSIGIACESSSSRFKDSEDLIKAADDALYCAKHAGRDRVEFFGQQEAVSEKRSQAS